MSDPDGRAFRAGCVGTCGAERRALAWALRAGGVAGARHRVPSPAGRLLGARQLPAPAKCGRI